MGTQVGSDLSVNLVDLDLDFDELGWQRPVLVQTPTKKRGEHNFFFFFLKLYLFRLSQRRLCCLQVISLSDCPRRKTASEDGCLGGFYSIAAGVLSC